MFGFDLSQALAIDPEDGFANMHYGFCLKFNAKYEEAIPYLRKGVESGAEGTQAGKFYSFLGDALIRTNRNAEVCNVILVATFFVHARTVELCPQTLHWNFLWVGK